MCPGKSLLYQVIIVDTRSTSMSCTVNPFRGLAYCIGFAYVFDFAKRILGDVFRPGMRKLCRFGYDSTYSHGVTS